MSNIKKLDQKEMMEMNPVTRVACCMVLDVSYSMNGKPIEELEKGFKVFIEQASKDPKTKDTIQLAIVTVGHKDFSGLTPEDSRNPKDGVKQIFDFNQEWKGMDCPNFELGGFTALGEGVELALDLVSKQKELQRKTAGGYNQPWILLMTDGKPYDHPSRIEKFGKYMGVDDDGNKIKNSINDIAEKTSELVKNRKINVIPVVTGPEADSDIVRVFNNGGKVLRIKNLDFKAFFKFFTATIGDPSENWEKAWDREKAKDYLKSLKED
tara:strand:- start:1298 stop:2098 length:801 start_codon:yes stop_codon:yes gene_type:complete